MKKRLHFEINQFNNFFLYTICLLVFIGLSACQEAPQDKAEEAPAETEQAAKTQIIIEAEDHIEVEENVKIEGEGDNKYTLTSGKESWLTFDVNVPVAGRYKFELHAKTKVDSVSVWMEDYIDNKDGRAYNVTGSVPVAKVADDSAPFATSKRDGSPLNKGLHKMKLHVAGGSAMVDKVILTLMKEHQVTPTLLTQKTDGKEWKVVWADEFDGEGMPDTSKWIFDIGDWGWGNNELQYYTENRLENARLENGNLIIEARKNDMGSPWTSARLTTRGKTSFLYGRIEFKAKVPVEKGNWAAGWTLGDDYVDELSWPYCGEIDILESVGYELDNETGDGKAHASAHCGAYYFKLGNQPTGIVDVKNMKEEYHIYAVDWTPEGIVASVDGVEYFTYNDTSTELAWPFGKAQNIILNLAMGGGWGGLQGMDETVTSQKFIIDYVRVYERQ